MTFCRLENVHFQSKRRSFTLNLWTLEHNSKRTYAQRCYTLWLWAVVVSFRITRNIVYIVYSNEYAIVTQNRRNKIVRQFGNFNDIIIFLSNWSNDKSSTQFYRFWMVIAFVPSTIWKKRQLKVAVYKNETIMYNWNKNIVYRRKSEKLTSKYRVKERNESNIARLTLLTNYY